MKVTSNDRASATGLASLLASSRMASAVMIAWLTVCLFGLTGCSELPPPASTSVGAAPESAVSSHDGREYNWRLNGQLFEVQRPTSFSFLDQLKNRSAEKTNFSPYVEPTTFTRPEGLDNDIYYRYRRFMYPHSPAKPILVIDGDQDVGVKVAAMNLAGTRMLTVGKRLIEWDINTGRRVREWPMPPLPVKQEQVRRVHYDHTDKTVILQTDRELHRLSLDDGLIKHSWTIPSNRIANVILARDADIQLVLNDQLEPLALANNFSARRVYQGPKILSKHMALHPKGKWALGVSKDHALRWRMDLEGNPVESFPIGFLHHETNCASSGARFDRWTDYRTTHEFSGSQESLIEPNVYPFTLLNSIPHYSISATQDGSDDWLVIFSDHGTNGQLTRIVQDISLQGLLYSVPWPMPEKGYQALWVDSSATCLAFVVGNQIKIYRRTSWLDPDGMLMALQVGELLRQGRTEQIEKIYALIRAIPMLRGNQTGEHFSSHLTDMLIRTRASLDAEPASADVMNKIEKWRQSGSQLALLVSAGSHIDIGTEARGGGTADTVTPAGWEKLQEQMELAAEELEQVLQAEQPPEEAFTLYLTAMRYRPSTLDDAEHYLKRVSELYPFAPEPYATMCVSLLPRWGGREGEGGGLVAARANLLPSPESEIFYAQVAVAMSRTFGPSILGESGLSLSRTVAAVDAWLERGSIKREEVELMMELAQKNQNLAALAKLGRYHLKHYGLPSRFLYQRTLTIQWFESFSEAIGDAEPPQ